MKVLNLLGILALLALSLSAQIRPVDVDAARFYSVSETVNLATAVVTISVPSTNTNSVIYPESVTIKNDTMCPFNIEVGGTTPTSVLLSKTLYVKKNSTISPDAEIRVSSDSTGPQSTITGYTSDDGTIRLPGFRFASGTGTRRTLTFRPQSCTGTGVVIINWAERGVNR